jgi:hypothetical protein
MCGNDLDDLSGADVSSQYIDCWLCIPCTTEEKSQVIATGTTQGTTQQLMGGIQSREETTQNLEAMTQNFCSALEETTQNFHVLNIENENDPEDCQNPTCLVNPGQHTCRVCSTAVCCEFMNRLSYGAKYCSSCISSLTPRKTALLVHLSQQCTAFESDSNGD